MPTEPTAKHNRLNAVDRLVAFFSPRQGLQRLHARNVLAAFAPYEAAEPSRLRKHYRDGYSPNQLTEKSAPIIRAQARQLQRNHDISRGILRTMVNNIVGPNGVGVEPQPRRRDGSIHEEYAAALREMWRQHSLKPEVTRRHTGAKVQRLMCSAWLRDGESFAQELIGNVPGLVHASGLPLSLEMFEADMVPYDYKEGDNTTQGIARNAWGQPVAYFVHKTHPSEGFTSGNNNLKRIPADRVHHVALLDRVGQMRGVSEFASIITRLEDIKDYEESERIAAKIAAAVTGVIKRGAPEAYDGPLTDDSGKPIPRSFSMQPGMIIDNLVAGEDLSILSSDRPNPNLVTYRQGQLRAVAAGVGASFSSVAKDYNGTFSAQRQELVEQWVNYAVLCDEFSGQFVQPWYASAVHVANLSGVVRTPADVMPGTADDCLFIAQSMPWIDPAKESAAYLELVRAGFASEVEVMRKRGINPRENMAQIKSWRDLTKEKDLVFNSNAAVPTNAGTANAADATDPPPPAS